MLTTFNEADMTEVMRLRKHHKETFKERHGVGLGFMSFFTPSATTLSASTSRPESVSSMMINFGSRIRACSISIFFISPPEKPSFT